MAKVTESGKERILRAYIEALLVKDHHEITVKELLARSGANRSTFYYHFDNLDDVNRTLMDGFTSSFRQGFERLYREDVVDRDVAADVICQAIGYVWDHQDAFRALLWSGAGLEFEERLRQVIHEECSARDEKPVDAGYEELDLTPRENDMYLRAYSAFIVAMLVYLADNGFEETPEEVSWLWIKFARVMSGETNMRLVPRG